jgi:hypothetical protein
LTVLLPTLTNSHILIWLFYCQPWQKAGMKIWRRKNIIPTWDNLCQSN